MRRRVDGGERQKRAEYRMRNPLSSIHTREKDGEREAGVPSVRRRKCRLPDAEAAMQERCTQGRKGSLVSEREREHQVEGTGNGRSTERVREGEGEREMERENKNSFTGHSH